MPFKVVLTEANKWTQPQREVQPAHHIVTNRRPQISLEALGYGPVGEKIEADPTMNGLECLLDESLGIGLNHGVEGPGNHRQLGTEAAQAPGGLQQVFADEGRTFQAAPLRRLDLGEDSINADVAGHLNRALLQSKRQRPVTAAQIQNRAPLEPLDTNHVDEDVESQSLGSGRCPERGGESAPKHSAGLSIRGERILGRAVSITGMVGLISHRRQGTR